MPLDIEPIRDAVLSHALASGYFEQVSGHEPKSPPPNGLSADLWSQDIQPIALASGLAATSARVAFWLRINLNMLMEPQDDIDPMCDAACAYLINALTGDLTLGGLIRNIDLLGAHGESLNARGGYLPIGNQMMRIRTINIPCIVNDCFEQLA